jgi:hypothetical protein
VSTQITHPANSPSGDRRTIAVELPAAANPELIDTAAGVIDAAMARGNREAYSLAFDLDAAGLLQSPETAAELEQLRAQVAELAAQRERRRVRLVALQNDALNMRGALSPNGFPRRVPMPLGETLLPAVEWLLGRVAELEAAVEAVRGQHYEVDGGFDEAGSCIQCGSNCPCATVVALAAEAPDPADEQMSNADIFTASELYEMDRDDEFRLDAEDDARNEDGAE